ncbi:MAG: sigma-70 family RNA polymerase sigma factor [Chloroflexota bacterium]|nr:MAG: sigma-70 family RNA polymerase sigma factor [Chloroflexota bacterium]
MVIADRPSRISDLEEPVADWESPWVEPHEQPADGASDKGDASTDGITMYLQEISTVPLLSAKEEVALAKAIEDGTAALASLGQSGLSDQEKVELRRTIQRGREAQAQLTRANLRLVVSLAKRYVNRGVPLSDLIQEGNLGLMRAVEKFDYHRGFKFSTYATWWIRQAVTRAIADQGRVIRLPVHMVESVGKLSLVSHRLLQETGHEPDIGELAEQLELPSSKIAQIMQAARKPLSLETPVGTDDDRLGDFVEDSANLAPIEAATREMLSDDVRTVLSLLPLRERRVLELRFGFDDGRDRTLEEVGQELGLTRERVRQIEAKALRQLRHPSQMRVLQGYME